MFRILSPAKINLHLDIGPPGEQGFHSLISLFLMLDFCDEITVEVLEEQKFRLQGFSGIPLEKNILYRCWNLARERGLFHKGLSVQVIKRIPSGAGLGGGSSNAASLIKLMQATGAGNFTKATSLKLAADLGSDVPFFLGSPLALARGRGETLQSVNLPVKEKFLLIHPSFAFSTADMYRRLDKKRAGVPWKGFTYDSGALEKILRDSPRNWTFFNSFTDCLPDLPGHFGEWSDALSALGASFSMLSGSGSTFFACFPEGSEPVLPLKESCFKNTEQTLTLPLALSPEAVVV